MFLKSKKQALDAVPSYHVTCGAVLRQNKLILKFAEKTEKARTTMFFFLLSNVAPYTLKR